MEQKVTENIESIRPSLMLNLKRYGWQRKAISSFHTQTLYTPKKLSEFTHLQRLCYALVEIRHAKLKQAY